MGVIYGGYYMDSNESNYNEKGYFLVLHMKLHSKISYILENEQFFSI